MLPLGAGSKRVSVFRPELGGNNKLDPALNSPVERQPGYRPTGARAIWHRRRDPCALPRNGPGPW